MNEKFWKNKKILVTGGAGFLGKNLIPKLETLNANVFVPKIENYDLTDKNDIDKLFQKFLPEIVIHLAADVGGIGYLKSNKGKIFYNNVMMNTLLMEKCRTNKVQKFIGICSVNCYPQDIGAPFNEEQLFSGNPEENVISYGISKRMMIAQSKLYKEQYNFNAVSLILDNFYGPNDVFTEGKSRVIPANIKRCIDAKNKNLKEIIVWGSGKSLRDYIYVDDIVKAVILVTEKYGGTIPLNIGTGNPITIKTLIEIIKELTGFKGEIKWDTTKPDGQMVRYLDTTRAQKELGFKVSYDIKKGLKKTIDWYIQNRMD